VCRAKQTEDLFLEFKEKVENVMREKYKDAITSLESELKALKDTLRIQTMFVTARPRVSSSGDLPEIMHRRVMELLEEVTPNEASVEFFTTTVPIGFSLNR
jgi:hypothetical protein